MQHRAPYFGIRLPALAAFVCVLSLSLLSCGEDDDTPLPPGCGDNLCSETESLESCPIDCDYDVVVVVEEAIREDLEESLEAYLEGLASEGYRGLVRGFEPAPVSVLRSVLTEEYVRHNIEGALLVGNLPVAWYRQFAFEVWEEFPMDIYLEDLDAVFYDDDSDGMLDRHSPLHLELFTSRLHADVETLARYFERVSEFRRSGPLLEPSALVFVDDDWSRLASHFALDSIYRSVTLVSDPDETSRERYIELLTLEGYEFVLQMMHSTSSMLFFEGEGTRSLRAETIRTLDLRCSFVHMWNCFVTRFPEEDDLGTIFALENEHGLAVIGSTKKGAVRPIEAFHGNLAQSQPLGSAFRTWYNNFGRTNDEWSLGILLMGDPMLTVWGDITGMTSLQVPFLETPEETARLERILIETPVPQDLGTFEDYRRDHPEFFPE